jgi:hypothetical protein
MVVASIRNHANLHTYSLQSIERSPESRTSACSQHVHELRIACMASLSASMDADLWQRNKLQRSRKWRA